MIDDLKILAQHGKQYIPDISNAEVPAPFRGLPVISNTEVDTLVIADFCPANAITANPFSIDMGKCAFCGECALAFPDKISFSNYHKTAANQRETLIVKEGDGSSFKGVNPDVIRKEITGLFGRSLKLRQVSAAGDNSAEMELGACGNVNFDMGRFGIEFTASPRHSDGIVITGPISENMAEATKICYEAVSSPKLIILVGTDAISGGIFADSLALNRKFLRDHYVDLYVPGNPPHPLTFINGILELIRNKK
jgi:Ni,Fe-hydrogenase III small subunit